MGFLPWSPYYSMRSVYIKSQALFRVRLAVTDQTLMYEIWKTALVVKTMLLLMAAMLIRYIKRILEALRADLALQYLSTVL